jgi:hypothetical protein
MGREFIITEMFVKLWEALKLDDDALRQLQTELLINPHAGDLIVGTSGARKFRFPLPSTGKSGGIRVIYFDNPHREKLYLLVCYPKGRQDDLTQEQKSQLKKAISLLKGEQ